MFRQDPLKLYHFAQLFVKRTEKEDGCKFRLPTKLAVHFPKTKGIAFGTPDRSLGEIFVKDYIEWLKQRIGESKFPSLVSELGFKDVKPLSHPRAHLVNG